MHCNLPARTPRPRPDRCHASAGWLPALLCCLLLVRLRITTLRSYVRCTCLHCSLLHVQPTRGIVPNTQQPNCTLCCAVNMPDSQLPAAGCCCCRCVPVPAMLLLLQRSEHRNRGRRLRCAHAAACGATRSRGVRRGQRAAAAAAAGRGRQGAATLARARGELTPTPHSRECRHRRVKSGHASGHTHGPARHRAQGAGRRWPLAGSGRLPRAGLSSGFANCFFAQLLSY